MKYYWFRYGLEELKFIRSLNDLKILYNQKLPLFITRITKRYTYVPFALQIEPTNNCNLKCISCGPREKMKREKGYMDFNFFQKIIHEASEIGVKKIHLYACGEPLLHPQIIEMIVYIKSKDLAFTLATNGMLLNERKIKAILNSGVTSADTIIFSILGYSKKVHEKIMVGANQDIILQNVYDFLQMRKKFHANGPIIKFDFYKMPENEREVAQFVKKWRGIVDRVRVNDASNQFAGFNIQGKSITQRKRTCSYIWERMVIYWNGDVPLCGEYIEGTNIVGNLHEKSIKDIWNCEEISQMKKLHKERKFENLPFCARCDI